MRVRKRALVAVIAVVVIGTAGIVDAQEGAAAVGTTTLWNFLGIPQAFNKIRDVTTNRRGNFPRLERKPPLKAIADPENLESDNPAIKKAAEIKAEEDLAKQKIKAIKYLAKIGCGCYPGVKEALMAALDDCTEKVRLEAARAIRRAANRQCEVCDERCCCDEELTKKLAEIAYERDDEGCCLEKSDRVRRAAQAALEACCPGGEPPYQETIEQPMPLEVPGEPEPPEVPGATLQPEAPPEPPDRDTARRWQHLSSHSERPRHRVTPVIRGYGTSNAVDPTERMAANDRDVPTAFEQMVPPIPARVTLRGTVIQLDYQDASVHINLAHGQHAHVGSQVKVYHQYLLGESYVGDLEVVQSRPGHAIAQLLPGGKQLAKVAKGDRVVILP